MNETPDTALTIAGFDPSGGAGIQADLKVFSAFGVYGLSVAAALTAQNSIGVAAVRPVEPAFVRRQLTALLSDMRPSAVKTGMLYSAGNVEAVSSAIKRHGLTNVVVDPVLLSTSGWRLSSPGIIKAFRERLLPLCTVVTPNVHEASVLAGIGIKTTGDMKEAARILRDLGAGSVIITGGHFGSTASDLLYDGAFSVMKGRKFAGEYHGTGCRFSAAIAALLARGRGVPEAAEQAKAFIREAIKKTFSTGKGMRLFYV